MRSPCFAAAVSQFVAERGTAFGGSISWLITGDEEGISINGTRKMLDWLKARGERLDACIVGEPTNAKTLGDMVKIGRRGSLTGTLTVHGTRAILPTRILPITRRIAWYRCSMR